MHRCTFVFAAVLVATGAARADVDWARGVVTADGVGVADRHAPSPAVARGTSRRVAEEAAKRRLKDEIGKLPLAGGGVVGERGAVALDRAFALAAEPETDGAWRVTMAVPIEAIRQAVAGRRALPAGGDGGPPVVVVEGVTRKPAIGLTIGGVPAATVWVDAVPDWAKDAPRVKVKAAKDAAIEVDRMTGTAATLFVMLRYRP